MCTKEEEEEKAAVVLPVQREHNRLDLINDKW